MNLGLKQEGFSTYEDPCWSSRDSWSLPLGSSAWPILRVVLDRQLTRCRVK
jgi:hypothetical protein